MPNKLVKDMDEETWRRFTAFCKLKNAKVSAELKRLIDDFLEKNVKEIAKDMGKGGDKK